MLLLPWACSRCYGCFALLSSSLQLRGAVLLGWGLLGCRSRRLVGGEHNIVWISIASSLTQGLLSLSALQQLCLLRSPL